MKTEDHQYEIKCMCGQVLKEEEVTPFLDDKYKDLREKISLRLGLSKMPDFKFCVKPNCPGGGCISKGQSFVLCFVCNFKFCPECDEEFHLGITCEQRKKWKEENNKNESQTLDWCNKQTKACPNCNVRIEKNGGCAHMRCAHCSYEFCWICNEKYWDGHIREKHGDQRTARNTRPQPRQMQLVFHTTPPMMTPRVPTVPQMMSQHVHTPHLAPLPVYARPIPILVNMNSPQAGWTLVNPIQTNTITQPVPFLPVPAYEKRRLEVPNMPTKRQRVE